MPQRALVAGGAGFVGSHLCDELLRRGYEVVAIDTLLTGGRTNVDHLVDEPNFILLHHDAADALSVEGHFDLVLHFASPASPPWYMKYPIETLHAGSIATEALLRVAERDNARFILASTSEVYGDPAVHPQPESYWGNVNPNGPRSVYDEAKRYAEALTAAFRRSHRVNTGIVRIFNTYGPRMALGDGRMIPAFAAAALKNDPIPLHGDGTQTRSLTYVGDLVRGVLALADSDQPGPINIGNPREQTVREIAEVIVKLAGSTSEISYQPRPVDDPERRRPDISLARELLDWEPEVDSETGLAETVEWFRTHSRSAHDSRRPE
ncbi:UDP-glucuronic acid decarboxylase family protein [Gryllotalpicola protaetiae]|uniref:SDR family oxidoreductase n=1 Tax=Gryllotalpicola protaetiae TaxID=2419771 RepID=A0A387BT92_9MICO|nr:UDP-glucuronic acid decarboxylase family protein [Gryllotalpicola protaetiae]AYG04269.1 SDR family oxidoreductase [Gryllotalpicola protaetiae]